MEKKALIVANLVGFASFLVHDMQIPIEKGYVNIQWRKILDR